MLLKTSDGTEYHAHFWHHPIGKKRRRPHLRTEVRLHEGPCILDEKKSCTIDAPKAVATTHSRLDVFDKRKGRALAFDRVLKGLTGFEKLDDGPANDPFPRAIRLELWEAYKHTAKLPPSNGSKL